MYVCTASPIKNKIGRDKLCTSVCVHYCAIPGRHVTISKKLMPDSRDTAAYNFYMYLRYMGRWFDMGNSANKKNI